MSSSLADTTEHCWGHLCDDRVDSYHWLILGHSYVLPVLKEREYCKSLVPIVRNSVSPKRKTVLGSQATAVHCNKLFLEHVCSQMHRQCGNWELFHGTQWDYVGKGQIHAVDLDAFAILSSLDGEMLGMEARASLMWPSLE